MFKKKYRIVDYVDHVKETACIILESSRFFDRLTGFWHMVDVYPYTFGDTHSRDEARTKASVFLDRVLSHPDNPTETILSTINA